MGDVTIPSPSTVLAENLHAPFDLILLSCKAYDLEGAIASFAPAVGPNTVILPLLNGMHHLDVLDQSFGPDRVMGGLCFIAASLNEKHEIAHLNENHDISFGERSGGTSARVQAIAEEFRGARCNAQLSTEIVLEMWQKWVFITTLAGGTCLLRASIGDIVTAPGGKQFMVGLLEECRSVAASEGQMIRETAIQRLQSVVTSEGSSLAASMLRDIERNAPIEADHIVGDMLRRGRGKAIPEAQLERLAITFTHLKAYEARRERELKAGAAK
jgi:2-dehydropantoate 2-reductase